MKRFTRVVTIGALGMILAACGDDGGPISPAPSPTVDVRAALDRSIQDEYRAEATYQAVLGDHGAVLPFANVVIAERQHVAAVAQLFASRGLAVPASAWSASNVQHYATVRDACAGGAAAERANIAMYDELLGQVLPADVRQVFTNLRAVSLTNHLPAFEICD